MTIQKFFVEEEGQTLVEYGLLISLVAIAVIAAMLFLGRRVGNTFNKVGNNMTN